MWWPIPVDQVLHLFYHSNGSTATGLQSYPSSYLTKEFPIFPIWTIIPLMNKQSRNFSSWPIWVAAGALGLGGLALLRNLIGQWPVSAEQDWRLLFFVALWLALVGIALPLIWLLHRRFGRPDAGEDWRSFLTLARQAAWVGTWGTTCAWLQTHRTLNWAMALLLVIVLLLLEALLLTRQEAKPE